MKYDDYVVRAPGTRARRKPRLRWIPIAAIAIAFVVALGIGYTLAEHRTPWSAAIAAAIPSPRQVFGKSNLRVLVVGLDYDYSDQDQETSAHSRSDIIMAVNLDLVHHRVFELSVPRDMVATLPNGQQAKINQAQADGGIAESQQVVAGWLGIPPFDRYAVLRIDTMKDLITAIGGVDLYVKNSDCLRYKTQCKGGSINYDDSWGHLHVHLNEGMQHLDGPQAVGYARFRHDWCSDPCRIVRQQEVLRAILGKLRSGGLNNLGTIRALTGVIDKDVQTNLTTGEQISLAYAFRNMKPSNIKTAQVPYTADIDLPGYGDSIIPDQDMKRKLVQTMLLSPPPPVANARETATE